jgi:dTDP-4-dehydrorhamnose reductase
MKILLIGSNGQVGWELQRALMPLGNAIALGRDGIDLAQPDRIRQRIREIQPHLIINAAAYTAVDRAESEPELAMLVNGIAPGIIAEEAKLIGAGVVHYSTDYVFNGDRVRPYTEHDVTDPQNIYGKTKLAGEKAIQAVNVPHLILRTSWIYSLRGKNFLLTMLKLAREKEELKVVNDQIGTPTWSWLVAASTAQILAGGITNLNNFWESHSGTYHLTASTETNWYEFAKTIFKLDPDRTQHKLKTLIPIPSSQYPTPAKRPKYSCLNTQKISNEFGLTLPHWQKDLETCMSSDLS